MAGIGKEDYPELTLTEAFEIVEKVGRENVKTATGLATVMGLKSPDSGYFYHRVSALTKYYGLLDRAKGNVNLTTIGERIAHPLSESDKAAARAEAASKVPLLRSLFDTLGSEFHDADFRTKLRDVTQAPLAEIEKNAPFIERLYRDSIRYFSAVGQASPSRTPSPPPVAFPGVQGPPSPRDLTRDNNLRPHHEHEPGFRTFESDGVYLKIKKDRDSLEEALATIQGWLRRYSKAQDPEKEVRDE
jgi:hypothetical protein